jgi:hypothetical protein
LAQTNHSSAWRTTAVASPIFSSATRDDFTPHFEHGSRNGTDEQITDH